MARSLYICYFGIREPLVQTQVLPYLRELKKDKHEIILLTFEPDFSKSWTIGQIAVERENLLREGIEWQCLPYHKRPSALATAYDIFRGALKIRRLLRSRRIDILHGRVHIPTLMGAIGRKLSRCKAKLLFDIRGFMPEEYADAGIWPEGGLIYRTAKRVEKRLMKEADGFVVLTEKAREMLFPEANETRFDRFGRPVEVIPCCVDFDNRFARNGNELRHRSRQDLGVEDRFVIAHLGELGGLYLTNEIADFLRVAKSIDPKTFALFLTKADPNRVIPLLEKGGFSDRDFLVKRVDPTEVPGYLSASDAALSFVKAGYATASRSPTKIPEYLACGVPVVANKGVGDVDKLIVETKTGVLVDNFDPKSYRTALERIQELCDIRERCRQTAKNKFDLVAVGGERYRRR